MYASHYEKDLARERAAVAQVERMADELVPHLIYVWGWGDGYGGYILNAIAEAAKRRGVYVERPWDVEPERTIYKKAKIPARLRTQVMERDLYRCRHCGTHRNLSCDHVIPDANGGQTIFENLQTLCRSCNSKKGRKMPETEAAHV